MDSTYVLSGARDPRVPRSRLPCSRPKINFKNTNIDIDHTLGTQLGARATDGTAAVGARTMGQLTIVHIVYPSYHQGFPRELQTIADGGDGLAEG
jgi:hypothetical protein